ncbi:MAG: cyclic nucleotide-binding domain-containing protein, partial [Rhodospirillales bacterium]
PIVVIAGILIVFSVNMLDRQTWLMAVKLFEPDSLTARRDLIGNIAVVLLVMFVTVVFDFVSATGVGLVIASLFFASRMGETVIRRQHRGDRYHSKTARPTQAMEILERDGAEIVIFEAQGPIFFGSADQLAKNIQESLDSAEFIILDMRRVTEVDSTGLDILLQIDESITSQGKAFYISYLTEDRPLKRAIMGLAKDWPALEKKAFPDTDTALSLAEDKLLRRVEGGFGNAPELQLSEIDVLKGLGGADIAFLETIMARQEFSAGATIFAQGEAADAMYFLAAGTVSVRLNIPGQPRTVRLASFKPGVVFGEMGLMRAEERSANVIADDAVVCYSMTVEAFRKLGEEHPEILAKMLLNMSRELSERLRITSDQVGELET